MHKLHFFLETWEIPEGQSLYTISKSKKYKHTYYYFIFNFIF